RRVELPTPDGRVTGRAVDLRDRPWSPSVSELRDRLPRDGSWRERAEIDGEVRFSTVTDDPPPLRQLLAVAGRSRGIQTPYDDGIRRLAGGDGERADGRPTGGPDAEDLRAARRAVAETGTEVERLRERVAMLRGRLQARRETEAGVETVQSDLDTAMRDLTEAETEQLAAEQRLTQVREAVREVRDDRRESMRRADTLENRLRDAREYLADAVSEPFTTAVETFGSQTTDGAAVDGTTAHLAAVAVAETTEPVILA
ncbi:MAG: hypothetical protein ABEI99_12280, partial [Halobaculum sp.]